MKRAAKPKRNRLEGVIAKEARAGNLPIALDVARSGFKCTLIGRNVRAYLRARKHDTGDFAKFILDPMKLNQLPPELKTGKTMRAAMMACNLCQLFLEAVDKGNIGALQNIIGEVKRFRDMPDDAAPTSADLIMLKHSDFHGTTKDLAKILGIEATPQFYRKVKEFGIRLTKNKVGRPKGAKNKL